MTPPVTSPMAPPGADGHERLIHDLAADLRPVRRLRPPGLRALAWLAAVGVAGAGLASISDLGAVRERFGRPACGARG